jgi:TonB family protein
MRITNCLLNIATTSLKRFRYFQLPDRRMLVVVCEAGLIFLGFGLFLRVSDIAYAQNVRNKGPMIQRSGRAFYAPLSQEINMQIENSNEAPLTIISATVRTLKTNTAHGGPDNYMIKPSVTLTSNARKRITAYVLNIKNIESGYEYEARRTDFVINPGSTFNSRYGKFVSLPGDPHHLRIKVVGVKFRDGSNWGSLVALSGSAKEPLVGHLNLSDGAVMSGTTSVPARVGGRGQIMAASPTSQESRESPPHVNLPYFIQGGSKMIRLGGGILQHRATKRVQPRLPAGISPGTVVIEVIVDEEGRVESARAVSGEPFRVATSNDPSLENAALEAARQWKFKPEKVEGDPVKIIGELFFTFR